MEPSVTVVRYLEKVAREVRAVSHEFLDALGLDVGGKEEVRIAERHARDERGVVALVLVVRRAVGRMDDVVHAVDGQRHGGIDLRGREADIVERREVVVDRV